MGEQKTTLSQSIDTVSDKEKYDAACKKILAEKIILAWIMKYTMKEYANYEAQNDFYPGYPIVKRGIYYCSRMISSQYGTVFTRAHYEKIQKVYSIWICMTPPDYRKNTITQYSMQEESLVGNVTEENEYYDLLTTIIICLGSYEKQGEENELLKLLDVLLSSDKKAVEKKHILETEFGIPMTEELEGEMEKMCNLSEGVERRGIEKGIAQGVQQAKIEMTRNLFGKLPDKEIAEVVGLPLTVVNEIFQNTNQ